MASKKNLPVSKITPSTSGLRMAMMANSILQSVQVEIEYHKYVNANMDKIGDKKVITLGTDIALGKAA